MGLYHRHHHEYHHHHHGHRHHHHHHHGHHHWHHRHHHPTTITSSNTVSTFYEEERQIKESTSSSSEVYERVISYVRSRNVEFDATSVKPFSYFTPFFSTVKVEDHITPKLLEVRMINGSFQAGETIESSDTFVDGKFIARLCVANHKEGNYITPFKTYSLNPYTRQPLPEEYSDSSTILNIDTKSLELPSETNFYGLAKSGMILNGRSSGASAIVLDIRLVSDINGRLIGSFFVPDPNTAGNPKFSNGNNTFTLLDVDDLSLSDQARSIAEADYYSMGTENITETTITTTREIKVVPAHTKNITTTTNTEVIHTCYKEYLHYILHIYQDMKLILRDLDELTRQRPDRKIFKFRWKRDKLYYKIWKYRICPEFWDIIPDDDITISELQKLYIQKLEELNAKLPEGLALPIVAEELTVRNNIRTKDSELDSLRRNVRKNLSSAIENIVDSQGFLGIVLSQETTTNTQIELA